MSTRFRRFVLRLVYETPLEKLVGVALLGAPLLVGAAALVQSKFVEEFKKQSFYHQTLETLSGHRDLCALIGEPIKLDQPNVNPNEELNMIDGLTAKVTVNFAGQKRYGTLFSWSARESLEGEWTLQKADIKLQDQPQQ